MSLGPEKVEVGLLATRLSCSKSLEAIGAVKRLITHIGGGSSMYISVNPLIEII
jgi:hypothetical protein